MPQTILWDLLSFMKWFSSLGKEGLQLQLQYLRCFNANAVENSERDDNTRPPDLPLEKPVFKSGSNS